MFAVEIVFSDDDGFAETMASMRAWLDHRHFEPGLFRYRFDGPRIMFEISFAIEAEAVAFSEAFGGTRQEERTAA